jgi:flavin reductase (DIM6/NTAB) family NADH-FMN oxidoreductase RutF
MNLRTFKGFGGLPLQAEDAGDTESPAILIIYEGRHTQALWQNAALALQQAGRHTVLLAVDHDGRQEHSIEHIRAVLAQLGKRPVVLASDTLASIATEALAVDAVTLAAGLILVNPNARADITPPPGIPILVVVSDEADAEPFAGLDHVECVAVDANNASENADVFNALVLDFLERRQPLAPPEYLSGSDARTLRDAMGCFATGVTIVTARSEDGTPIGLTANSFTSVSLDPPLLLVCIANKAGSAPVLRDAGHFAVNVLQIGQQPTSNRFAGKGEDRFAATPWEEGESGLPVLTGSLGIFECRQHAVHEAGDHFILIGHVLRARFEPRRDPLLYFRGKYRRLHFA